MREMWRNAAWALVVMAALTCGGCMVVYVSGRGDGSKPCLVYHEQHGSNLVNNATVPITQKVADAVTGAVGAQIDAHGAKVLSDNGSNNKAGLK